MRQRFATRRRREYCRQVYTENQLKYRPATRSEHQSSWPVRSVQFLHSRVLFRPTLGDLDVMLLHVYMYNTRPTHWFANVKRSVQLNTRCIFTSGDFKGTKAEKRSFYLSYNSPETGNGIVIIVTFLIVLIVLLKWFSLNYFFMLFSCYTHCM